MLNFRGNICFPNFFRENVKKNFVFVKFFAKIYILQTFYVLAVMSKVTWQAVQSHLSRRSCPRCPLLDVLCNMVFQFILSRLSAAVVQARLSCPGYPVPAVLIQLLPGNLIHSSVIAVMSWLAGHLCPAQAHLLRLTCQTNLPWLTFPSVLSKWSFPVLSQVSCQVYHMLYVLS